MGREDVIAPPFVEVKYKVHRRGTSWWLFLGTVIAYAAGFCILYNIPTAYHSLRKLGFTSFEVKIQSLEVLADNPEFIWNVVGLRVTLEL